MATIVTRSGKGSALTHTEMDANFNNLNNAKAEQSTLGTAASEDVTTSSTDTTAGRLLKVGDFGLGGQAADIPNNNANDIVASGLYMGSGVTNAPDANWFYIESYVHHDLYQTQTAVSLVYGVPQKLVRSKLNGTWTTWAAEYNQKTILGTVSQSGGVPTGAIIERGSNANGEYVKYADGTLICKTILSAAHTSTIVGSGSFVNYYRQYNFSWPHTFGNTDYNMFASTDSGYHDIIIAGAGSKTTTTASQTISCGRFDGLDYPLRITAIGRWY